VRLWVLTLLPYALDFEAAVTQVLPPSMLEAEATGDLEGTGRWALTPTVG